MNMYKKPAQMLFRDSKFDLPEFQVGDLLWCMMLFQVYTIVIPLHQKADDTFLCL